MNRTSSRLALFILAVAAFSPILPLPFMIDDRFLIPSPPVPSPWSWAFLHQCLTAGVYTHGGGTAYTRPLFSAYIGTMAWLFGSNPFGYHLASLLIHGVNAVLAFELLQSIGLAAQPAFLTAALFGVHPAIIGEMMPAAASGMLALTFSFASLCALQRSRPRAYGFGVGLFAAALLVKESNVMIPALFALTLYVQRRLRRDGIRVLPLLIVVALYAGYRAWAGPATETPPVGALARFYLHAFPLMAGQLAAIALAPLNLMSWRALPPPTRLWPLYWAILIGALMLAHRQRKDSWKAFALGWFVLSVAPFLIAVTLHGTVMDQWVYSGLVGLLVPIGLELDRLMRSPLMAVARGGKAVFAGLLLAGFMTVGFNVERRGSDVKNFRWTFQHFPAADFAKQRFLAALIQEGHWREAELYREHFHAQDPTNKAYLPNPQG